MERPGGAGRRDVVASSAECDIETPRAFFDVDTAAMFTTFIRRGPCGTCRRGGRSASARIESSVELPPLLGPRSD